MSPILGGHRRTQREIAREQDFAAWIDALAEQVAAAVKLTVEADARAERTNRDVIARLEEIHGLVNSTMTEAKQSELEATVRELAMMKQVIVLQEAAGQLPTPDALAALDATQTRIGELRAAIKDRLQVS